LLACRIYFCEPDYHEQGQELFEKYLAQLKKVFREHAVAWSFQPASEIMRLQSDGRDSSTS